MKKSKKIIAVSLSVVLLLGLIGGGIYWGIQSAGNKVARVVPVEYICGYGGNDALMTSGYVQTAQTQEVYLDGSSVLKEVYVQEGDAVEVGDPILAYDSTLQEMELERQKLSIESAELYQSLLEKEIEELRGMKPAAASRSLNKTGIEEDSKEENPQPEEPEEPEQPKEPSGSGTVEDPLQYPIAEDHKELTAEEWEELRGKVVCFVAEKPVSYRILIDLREAEPLAEGTNFSLAVEARVLRDTVTILTFLQKEWPTPFTFYYSLDEGQIHSGLQLDSLSASEKVFTLDVNQEGMLTVELEEGGIYLLTADKTTGEQKPEPKPEPEPGQEPEPEPEPDPGQEPEPEPEPDPGQEVIPMPEPGGYTQEELAQMIHEKEQEYTQGSIDLKLARLAYRKAEKKLEDSVIKSTVSGTVKSVGEPEELLGGPYIVLSASEGFYVTGTMSELQLEKVKAGQTIVINSWMTGMTYTGQLTEIAEYPEENGYYSYMDGNPNVSFYRFTAYIDKAEGLYSGEGVSIAIQEGDDNSGETLYIPNMYVRKEQGESYVLKRGEDGRLVKQPVITGRSLYGWYTEIKEGLTREDYVAFPYGSLAKEGLETEEDENYMYFGW